jgi:MerR family mercuric resistance operon transcriptional regulator
MNPPLTIGRVARLAGVHVETIRYYQRRGLIQEPPKPRTGYRHYPPATVQRLRFIKRAQQLGFSLAEIGELLELEQADCRRVQQVAADKCREIERQIGDLQSVHRALKTLLQACSSQPADSPCPIVRSLSE